MNIKLIIAALAVAGFVACGGGKKDAEEPAAEETPTGTEPEPAPEPEPPAEGGPGGGAPAPGTGGGAAAEPKN